MSKVIAVLGKKSDGKTRFIAGVLKSNKKPEFAEFEFSQQILDYLEDGRDALVYLNSDCYKVKDLHSMKLVDHPNFMGIMTVECYVRDGNTSRQVHHDPYFEER